MKKLSLITLLSLVFIFSGCEIDEVPNPNGPNLFDFLGNPSQQDIDLLVAGLEARARDGVGGFITATGTISRELYFFNSSDPTTTETLPGKDGATLNGSEPQLTGTMFARYQAVKSAEFILDAVEVTSAVLTEAQRDGYRGVANTFKGLMLLDVLDLLNSNGVRVDVRDPENLGPYLSRTEGFAAIRSILDEGFNQLQGGEFLFQLSSGFAGFDTPATFAQFNRAVAARVAIHQGDYAGALSLVQASFLDIAGDLTVGPKRVYGNSGFEVQNPIFKAPQQSGDQFIVNNRMISDIQAGDTRISKFRMRNDPVGRDGLNGTHEIALYATATSPKDHIRNEELVLIYAEANIQQGNFADAITALNAIRNAYGLGDYAGAGAEADLIDEMLYNRTYSLWAEGHAMFDLRRYGRLNDTFLPNDRAGDIIHTEFPIPPFEQ
ncbi:MAG: RagB/SusD family nutrient uptake outer membrane protein [Cytophagales bacterium]|nr:RagB/SusD family nutrient uptake outer membrane protein [Cytophagales bacterium]